MPDCVAVLDEALALHVGLDDRGDRLTDQKRADDADEQPDADLDRCSRRRVRVCVEDRDGVADARMFEQTRDRENRMNDSQM